MDSNKNTYTQRISFHVFLFLFFSVFCLLLLLLLLLLFLQFSLPAFPSFERTIMCTCGLGSYCYYWFSTKRTYERIKRSHSLSLNLSLSVMFVFVSTVVVLLLMIRGRFVRIRIRIRIHIIQITLSFLPFQSSFQFVHTHTDSLGVRKKLSAQSNSAKQEIQQTTSTKNKSNQSVLSNESRVVHQREQKQ